MPDQRAAARRKKLLKSRASKDCVQNLPLNKFFILIKYSAEDKNMKLICLLGNDPLQVLMPLQLTRLFDGAYLIVNERSVCLARQILAFLEANDTDSEGTPWQEAIHFVRIEKDADYQSVRGVISGIVAREYCRNEEVAFNYYSGYNRQAKLAMNHTANYFLAPLMVVDPHTHMLCLLSKSWDRQTIYREHLPWIPLKSAVSKMLDLEGITWERTFPAGSKGINYERKIFAEFTAAKDRGEFDDVERNLLFTWNQAGKTNEIDIVALRSGVICFISVKSGRNMKKAWNFAREYKKMITRYPKQITGIPCLHVLICKTSFGKQRFERMLADGILAIDDVRTDEQTSLTVDMTAYAADLIAKTGHPLPCDFYHRYINKQYGKWGNIIGRMRGK